MASAKDAATVGRKRERAQDDDTLPDADSHIEAAQPGSPPAATHSTTNFRNVSACNRCRNRKNRCDQRLPRCSGCEKANVSCVGVDPVSRREIPRSYVYYLETRLRHLEGVLRANNLPCPPPSDDFSISDEIKPGVNVPFPPQAEATAKPVQQTGLARDEPVDHDRDGLEKLDTLTRDVGMVSVKGVSDPRHADAPVGIPFARVVYAAVKSSVSQTPSEPANTKPSKQLPSATASGGGGSDSFFGLNSKPGVEAAPFPSRQAGLKLAKLYFEHANPQMPILHREEFMSLFERVYAADVRERTPKELYLLNMVFAIGSGIILDSSDEDEQATAADSIALTQPIRKRQRLTNQQRRPEPEEYHSAAMKFLDSFLGSTPAMGASGGLEELQAVLLLAGLALLRPIAPGLWYIVGVAVRLAVDLGLHTEEPDSILDSHSISGNLDVATSKRVGRKQWTRDMRRRLWWCSYAFDRLGRPFGITDQVIVTEFPSILDDKLITTAGFLNLPEQQNTPSYKLVAHHYFRLRLLQSEILQVLQYLQTEQARNLGANNDNPYVHKDLASPFLQRFHSFQGWRQDIDRRLLDWKESAPKQGDTGVEFQPDFLELNYWQAIILLYRQSVEVPEALAGELSPSTGEVQSPGTASIEATEDKDMVFMKVAQAGQMVLKIYRQLHRLKLVNYTFLATHHLFMSGISFLYAIWQSPLVRSQLTVDDVDYTVFIATSVLSDLVDKCPPAEACKAAFLRMSKATISMCLSTTGFGSASILSSQRLDSPGGGGYFDRDQMKRSSSGPFGAQFPPATTKMPVPQFDMNLKDLFSDEEVASVPLSYQGQRQRLGNGEGLNTSTAYSLLPSAKQPYYSPAPQASDGRSHYQAQVSPASSHSSLRQPLPQQPLESTSQLGSDFIFDDLDFLNSLPGDQSFWSTGGNDLDLGFGTGGNGGWDAEGGVDLFDGFYFGNTGT